MNARALTNYLLRIITFVLFSSIISTSIIGCVHQHPQNLEQNLEQESKADQNSNDTENNIETEDLSETFIVYDETNLIGYLQSQLQWEIPENAQVQSGINWYTKHNDYTHRTLSRAQPFLYYIIEQLNERNLPAELALLPIVESAYDPYAFSYVGASGLWQFMPPTAKRFGVTQDAWYDGRRSVVDSTTAAIDYLSFLNNHFNGDWLLTLAAYNAGEGAVRRAIARNQREGKPTDFWSLPLPRETRQYVPKLLALVAILQSPEEYNTTLPYIVNEKAVYAVDVGNRIDLALAAGLANIELEDLLALNPGFNRWSTSPQGPHTLLLPIEQVEIFKQQLATLSASDLVAYQEYQVRSNDTLSHIAKRHKVSINDIMQSNRLNSHIIRPGQTLKIPSASSAYQKFVTDNPESNHYFSENIIYTVRRGDNLWDIAKAYQVSTQELILWNQLNPKAYLSIGQKLNIHTTKNPSQPTQIKKITYRVRSGDSLYTIAKKFNTSIRKIAKWNQLSTKKYLQPGQRLTVYVDVTQQNS